MPINYTHTEEIHNTTSANEVLPHVFGIFHPRSVIDVGCGTGSWLSVAKQSNCQQILGIDGIDVGDNMRCIEKHEFIQHDLATVFKPSDKFDMAICLEVAEHLPPEASDNVVSTLTDCADVILFSAAVPGQGGQWHVNEQWPAYWQQKFASHNYVAVDALRSVFWDNEKVDWWYRQNMLLYVKQDIAAQLNLPVTDRLPIYIHQQLFEYRMKELEEANRFSAYLDDMVQKEIQQPRFFPTLKRLIKSIVK